MSAHPPSGWYRTRKFVRRHRGSVALTGAFVIAILASLGIAVWQANVARAEARNARAEAERANTTRAFVEALFEPVRDQLAEGRMPSLRDLVGAGAAQLDATDDLAPAQRVDLLLMFARLQEHLADAARSLDLAERAHALAVEALPGDSPVALQALFALGRARTRNNDLVGAEPLLREAERRFMATGVEGPALIELFAVMARLENEQGRLAESLRYAEREFEARRAHHGDDSAGMASAYNNLGYALEAVGRFDDAIDAYRKALDIDDRHLAPGSQLRAYPLGNLAQAEYNAGRLRDAREHFEQALAIHADVGLDKPSRSHLGQLAMLAATEIALGELERARPPVASFESLSQQVPPTDPDRAIARRLVAALAFEEGRLDDARRGLEALETLSEPLAALARQRIAGRRDMFLAELALLESRAEDAAGLARQALDQMGDVFYPRNLIPYAQALLAQACATSKAPVCAGDTYRTAADAVAQPYHHDHPAMLGAQVALARVELQRGDTAAAIARLQASASAALERDVAAGSPRLAQVNGWLGVALAGEGQCADAARAFDRTHAADAKWPDHPLVVEAQTAYRNLGTCAG